MANGHGGRRVGAGRKPKSSLEHALTGDPGHRGRVLPHPSAVPVPGVAPIDEFDAPDDLTSEERNVWLELAPFAFKNRTLTRATSYTFRLLCRNIVAERALRESVLTRNAADHRGLMREINTRLLQFQLAPCGKAILTADAEEATPVSKLDRFTKRA